MISISGEKVEVNALSKSAGQNDSSVEYVSDDSSGFFDDLQKGIVRGRMGCSSERKCSVMDTLSGLSRVDAILYLMENYSFNYAEAKDMVVSFL